MTPDLFARIVLMMLMVMVVMVMIMVMMEPLKLLNRSLNPKLYPSARKLMAIPAYMCASGIPPGK